jgi:hypothetical protein
VGERRKEGFGRTLSEEPNDVGLGIGLDLPENLSSQEEGQCKSLRWKKQVTGREGENRRESGGREKGGEGKNAPDRGKKQSRTLSAPLGLA